MVTLAQKYGTGSFYIERYYNNPAQYEQSFRVNKILRFYNYPYILDEWGPHFTLLSSYKQDENRHDINQFITEQFKEYNEIVVDTTCLLIQTRNGEFWKIHTEFTR